MMIPISVAANVLSWLLGLVGISFLDSVQIVGRQNMGFGYWAGFVLGVCAVGVGSSRQPAFVSASPGLIPENPFPRRAGLASFRGAREGRYAIRIQL
jgi:hypothetical protein